MTMEEIENISVELKDFELLLKRYAQLSEKSILTIQEMDEKKEIRERLKKYYYKDGEEGKKRYREFLKKFGE